MKRQIVVPGNGPVGSTIVNDLKMRVYQVKSVDLNQEIFDRPAEPFGITGICADFQGIHLAELVSEKPVMGMKVFGTVITI